MEGSGIALPVGITLPSADVTVCLSGTAPATFPTLAQSGAAPLDRLRGALYGVGMAGTTSPAPGMIGNAAGLGEMVKASPRPAGNAYAVIVAQPSLTPRVLSPGARSGVACHLAQGGADMAQGNGERAPAVVLAAEDIVAAEMDRVRGFRHACMITSGPGGHSAVCLTCGPVAEDLPLAIAQTWARVHGSKS